MSEFSPPNIKLSYFPIEGVVEKVRLTFAYLDIPFEDERISFDKFSEMKEKLPSGQLPIMEINGKTYTSMKKPVFSSTDPEVDTD